MPERPERARDWLDLVLDAGWVERFGDVVAADPLGFPGYAKQLDRARAHTGERESVVVAEGTIDGHPAVALSFEFGFLGGSMGTAAGERIARAFERGAQTGAAVIALVASGGARMQEGMLALAQMPATVAARAALARAGRPFLAYLRHPTTGGVYASFASLADLLWGEPGATLGFAGPRVAEVATGRARTAPRTAEEALEDGLLDEVVPPDRLRRRLASALACLALRPEAEAAEPPDEPAPRARGAWAQVALARHRDRPSGADYLGRLGALPLRRARGDPTVLSALCEVGGRTFVGVAQDRRAGDGRTRPPGFARAREAIALAGRLGLPLVTFVDTPGADPGAEAEAAGVAREIARTLEALVACPAPTVACVVGEGGSGGALALAACDRVLVQQNAIFSVIAPEAAAAILRRDDVPEVAEALRLTAADLRALGLADRVVPEPDGGAHAGASGAAELLERALAWALAGLEADPAGRARRWRCWEEP